MKRGRPKRPLGDMRFKDALELDLAAVNYAGWTSQNPPSETELTRRWQQMRPHCLVKVCLQTSTTAPTESRIKASCTAVLEPCLDGSIVVHGENMVTAKDMRRVGVARQLIGNLFDELPAYDVSHILCSSLQPMTQKLYREFGLRSAGIQMEHRLGCTTDELRSRQLLPPTIDIRRLQPADAAKGLGAVMAQAKEGHAQAELSQAQIEDYLRLSAGIKETFVVTQRDDISRLGHETIVGVGHLFFEHKLIEGEGRPTAHISGIVIDSAFRRQHLGRALFAQLVERAQVHEAWRILMQAEKSDLPFLKKQGSQELSLQLAKPVSPASRAYFDAHQTGLNESTSYLNAAYYGLWMLERIYLGVGAVQGFCRAMLAMLTQRPAQSSE